MAPVHVDGAAGERAEGPAGRERHTWAALAGALPRAQQLAAGRLRAALRRLRQIGGQLPGRRRRQCAPRRLHADILDAARLQSPGDASLPYRSPQPGEGRFEFATLRLSAASFATNPGKSLFFRK